MSDLSPLVADDGELRLARRVASYVYGRREVTWPEGVDDPEDGLPDKRAFGWVAKLPGPEPGLSERRFVRGDVQIDAVARVSNVERVLDDAASRAGGDVFFESMVEGRGLGRLVPGRDFDEGDLVDVRFWGRILQDQVVTAVEWHDGVPSVKLGGQLVSDTDELARARTETMRLISQERRERLESVDEVSQTAKSAQSAATTAQSAATTAQSVAVEAKAAANGKNIIWYSATSPGSAQGSRPGDTWFQYSGTTIVGQWKWSGSAWESQQIGDQVIANLDAGKITTGFLDAGRIAANTITATHLRVEPGNLFPDPHFKDPSWPWNSNVQAGPNNGGELVFFANGTHNAAFLQPEGKFDASVTLVPGAEYTLTAGRYADNEQTRRLSVYARYKKSDGSTNYKWLGDLTTPGLGVYTTTIRFKAPADMVGGLCSIGFALESDQTAGMASIWNVNLVRAADASLIVNGAIKAEHLEAGSITASRVNADEIFLKADGDKSLQEQWSGFNGQLDTLQSSIEFISRVATRADSTRRGIGMVMTTEVLGSTETKSLFTADNLNIYATGAWKGRFIAISLGNPAGSEYVELSGTGNRSAGASNGGSIILWERDPVVESTTTIKPTETWDAPQNAWTTIPGMSTTLAAGAISTSVNGNVYFTNVNRGSTYGVRVLVGENVEWTWQSNTFGPLTPLGDPTWYISVRFERNVSGNRPVEVQVLCGDTNGYKRRVTTDSWLSVTSYSQA